MAYETIVAAIALVANSDYDGPTDAEAEAFDNLVEYFGDANFVLALVKDYQSR